MFVECCVLSFVTLAVICFQGNSPVMFHPSSQLREPCFRTANDAVRNIHMGWGHVHQIQGPDPCLAPIEPADHGCPTCPRRKLCLFSSSFVRFSLSQYPDSNRKTCIKFLRCVVISPLVKNYVVGKVWLQRLCLHIVWCSRSQKLPVTERFWWQPRHQTGIWYAGTHAV